MSRSVFEQFDAQIKLSEEFYRKMSSISRNRYLATFEMRFLVLHGYGQNAALMRNEMRLLIERTGRRSVPLPLEFDFITSPFPASSRQTPDKSHLRRWWAWNRVTGRFDNGATSRFDPSGTTHYDTLIMSRQHVESEWSAQPGRYAGLFGFSQGAILASTFGRGDLPGLRARVLVAGMPIGDLRFREGGPCAVVDPPSTLRVVNRNDPVIPASLALSNDRLPKGIDDRLPKGIDESYIEKGKYDDLHSVPNSETFIDTLVAFCEKATRS